MVVVLVDDDIDDLEMFCEAVCLVDETFDCIPLLGGKQLLQFLAAKEVIPDFIFSDLLMPSISGWDCIQSIKSDHAFENTKIVAYSTMITDDQQKSLSNIDVAYLTKPNSFTDLVSEIKRILKAEC